MNWHFKYQDCKRITSYFIRTDHTTKTTVREKHIVIDFIWFGWVFREMFEFRLGQSFFENFDLKEFPISWIHFWITNCNLSVSANDIFQYFTNNPCVNSDDSMCFFKFQFYKIPLTQNSEQFCIAHVLSFSCHIFAFPTASPWPFEISSSSQNIQPPQLWLFLCGP